MHYLGRPPDFKEIVTGTEGEGVGPPKLVNPEVLGAMPWDGLDLLPVDDRQTHNRSGFTDLRTVENQRAPPP